MHSIINKLALSYLRSISRIATRPMKLLFLGHTIKNGGKQLEEQSTKEM